jgi:hypothetical protein
VSESAELLRMLRRIRLRARALAAVEGGVLGAALGLGAITLAALAGRGRVGLAPWRPTAVAAAGAACAALLGAALAAARKIPLVRCARLLDAAMDRGGPAYDRALSALSFASEPAAARAPLAHAALADTVARARAFAPSFVAPARRPRGLPALAGAGLALVVVSTWPARAPGARRDARSPATAAAAEPRLSIDARDLDAERAEIVAAATAAEGAGDVSLRALAREARATLDALSDGALGRGEALERLTALSARAREAAEEAEASRAGLRAASKALDRTAATRALGRALDADDAEATARGLDALAERAAASEDARAGIAGAFAAAAQGVASASSDDAARPGEGRRRLNRDGEATGAAEPSESASAPAARRLEQLRRDLEDAAAGCRDGAGCADRARGGTGGLPRAAEEGAQATARRRLESAVRQLRERLRRGDLDEGARERRFARVARGEARDGEREASRARGAAQGDKGNESDKGDGQGASAADEPAGGDGARGEGAEDVFVEEPAGEGAGATANESGGATASASGSAATSAEADGAPAGGNGAGREAGGDPLGRGSTPPTRGREREVHLRGGAGPTRSEVIEASARRGFATREYVRVFGDYQPVVEESLAAGAVPEGRRYVVRRYFQLIRPRADGRLPREGAPRTP